MNIELPRKITSAQWTIGEMSMNGVYECFTLEDEKRTVKVHGETRIPAGRYKILFRKVESEKTKKYRARFPWFTWHLELQNVPNFKYVYIHIGNTDKDSDGCILLGKTADHVAGTIGQSVAAFTTFYQKVSALLENGREVWITIVDEK